MQWISVLRGVSLRDVTLEIEQIISLKCNLFTSIELASVNVLCASCCLQQKLYFSRELPSTAYGRGYMTQQSMMGGSQDLLKLFYDGAFCPLFRVPSLTDIHCTVKSSCDFWDAAVPQTSAKHLILPLARPFDDVGYLQSLPTFVHCWIIFVINLGGVVLFCHSHKEPPPKGPSISR